uniref:Reverse transcriptase Ty1/copia-type domain-containing protein n=1 Tax=Solanum lycopersicum TaxID=4081 RepID=A0A3Q7F5P2_SOLLC
MIGRKQNKVRTWAEKEVSVTVNEAYATMAQDESQRLLGVVDAQKDPLTMMTGRPQGYRSRKPGGSGGLVELEEAMEVLEELEYLVYIVDTKNCYRVVDYPSDFVSKRKTSQQNAQTQSSQGKPTVNTSTNTNSEVPQRTCPDASSSSSGSGYFLTEQQYQELLGKKDHTTSTSECVSNMTGIHSSLSNVFAYEWIVDSGASHHTIPCNDLLFDIKKLDNHISDKVQMANLEDTTVQDAVDSISTVSAPARSRPIRATRPPIWLSDYVTVVTPKWSYSYPISQHKQGTSIVVILIYVDDLVITGNNQDLIYEAKQYLHSKFKVKDLGPLTYFLGIEIMRSKHRALLNQRKYALEVISNAGLSEAKPASTPLKANIKLTSVAYDDHLGNMIEDPLLKDISAYRRLVRKLIYLTIIRPDICFDVQLLSQFMQQRKNSHWDVALRIVRYLKHSHGLGVFYEERF